jgi:osmotically-inducible protein OsmY
MKQGTYRLALIAAVTAMFSINAPLYASETDDRIEASARQSFVFKTYLKDDDIAIQSRDGVVTLNGTVAEESHKSLAGETLASLPGVTRVDNNLTEAGGPPAVDTDARLGKKVKTTLLFHKNLNASETEVVAEDGIVILRGEVTNAAQKELATEYAKDVAGVRIVKNEMTVSADTLKPGEKTMGQKIGAMAESIDDISITALVKTTLLYHRSTSVLNTTVKTKDGMVRLGGKARNKAEKDLATKLVSDVQGVKMVVNDMTVEDMAGRKN